MRTVAILSVLILSLQSHTMLHGQGEVECPDTVEVDGLPVFVPHPTDCGLYYQCVGSWPVLMECPPGLYFDPTLNVCNWPDNVDCQPQTEAPETTTEAEQETTTETEEETTTEAEEETTTEAEEETTTDEEETTTEAEEETTTEAEAETTTEAEEETTTQAEEETTTQAEEETTTVAKGCAEGWVYFEHTGKCYKSFSSWKTWSSARSSCRASTNGDLASVPDQETNDFLAGLTSFRAWIGGYRNENNEWSWTDQTPWSYESWSWGNPNDFALSQNALQINYQRKGLWNDDMGWRVMGYICQY